MDTANLIQVLREQRERAEAIRQEEAKVRWAEWVDAFAEMKAQREAKIQRDAMDILREAEEG